MLQYVLSSPAVPWAFSREAELRSVTSPPSSPPDISLSQLCGCIVFSSPAQWAFHSAAWGECVWSHLFWSGSGALQQPPIHSSVTSSCVMHCPIQRSFTEGQFEHDVMLIVWCSSMHSQSQSGFSSRVWHASALWNAIDAPAFYSPRTKHQRVEKNRICFEWLLQRIHIPEEQCLYVFSQKSALL